MAYIRPCNKCGQRISMREMRHRQWVAFDASTETPQRCGKKTKANPNIKKLAKEKIKEKISEGVDLGYSDTEAHNPSLEQIDEINSKIDEVYEEISNAPPKVEERYKKETIKEKFDPEEHGYKITEAEKKTIEKAYEDKPAFGSPGTLQYYFWRGLVIFWVLMLLNGLLFGPFD